MDLGSHNIILGRKQLAYLGLQLNIWSRQLIWPETLPLIPSFIKEISIIIENLIRPQINTVYQANAIRKDQAFEKDVQLNLQQICILRRPQTTYVMPPALEIKKVNKKLAELPAGNLGPIQLQKMARSIRRYTKYIDQRDNLQKIEQELRKIINPKPQNIA